MYLIIRMYVVYCFKERYSLCTVTHAHVHRLCMYVDGRLKGLSRRGKPFLQVKGFLQEYIYRVYIYMRGRRKDPAQSSTKTDSEKRP